MQLLKALVIGMGILIVLGMGLLAYGLLSKTSGPSSTADQPADESALNAKGFGELALTGNTGCHIADTRTEGRRLIVTLAPLTPGLPELACEKIVIIDMTAGTVIGSVALQP